jgi:hypothetical protein
MTTNYNVNKSTGSVNGWSRQFSDTVFSALLAAATNSTIAVPLTAATGAITAPVNNKFYAIINCTQSDVALDDTFVSLNAAAVLPIAPAVGVVLNSVHSIIIPPAGLCMTVKSGDVLNFISGGTPNVVVEFYAIQE